MTLTTFVWTVVFVVVAQMAAAWWASSCDIDARRNRVAFAIVITLLLASATWLIGAAVIL